MTTENAANPAHPRHMPCHQHNQTQYTKGTLSMNIQTPLDTLLPLSLFDDTLELLHDTLGAQA